MRILVTGGAGYIGSHTAKALSQAGHQPVVLDSFSAGHRWAVKWGPLAEGDLADQDFICHTLHEFGIQAVIHFAADVLVGESVANPRKYYWNNVVNSMRLLDAMVGSGVRHIVFSSSCATYGVPSRVPIPEDHPQLPVNPYGETKLVIEKILRDYGPAYGLHWVALRYFNAAGADPDGEIGEDHNPETHLIPIAVQAAQGERSHIEIYGTDYPTPDGTAVRDYIHVADLARAHVKSLEYLVAGGARVALNLGTGVGHSVREVVAAVGKLSDGRVPFKEGPRRAGDPPALVAEVGKAEKVLDWKPEYPELDSIVETAWKWHASRHARAT
jgi:UDP-arabinose 4-epimerase